MQQHEVRPPPGLDVTQTVTLDGGPLDGYLAGPCELSSNVLGGAQRLDDQGDEDRSEQQDHDEHDEHCEGIYPFSHTDARTWWLSLRCARRWRRHGGP